jgi:translation initiation factor IF-2
MEDIETGSAEVLQKFTLTFNRKDRKAGYEKYTAVAGSKVTAGDADVSKRARVLRGGEVLHDGRLVSLKSFKQEVKTIKKGNECGIIINGFGDYQPGDVIWFFEVVPRRIGLYDSPDVAAADSE